MNIDATNLRVGRLATFVAKKLLMGEEVNIVNSELAVITGKRTAVLEKAKRFYDMGTPSTGPFHPRIAFKMLKRSIRGMLPHQQERGITALKRLRCYNGIPATFADTKFETLESANVKNSTSDNYVTLKDICKFLGGKE